jgi:hypothetical protein
MHFIFIIGVSAGNKKDLIPGVRLRIDARGSLWLNKILSFNHLISKVKMDWSLAFEESSNFFQTLSSVRSIIVM